MFGTAAENLGSSVLDADGDIERALCEPRRYHVGDCEYCGHCNRTACEVNAKASPNVNIVPVLRAEPKTSSHTRLRGRGLL